MSSWEAVLKGWKLLVWMSSFLRKNTPRDSFPTFPEIQFTLQPGNSKACFTYLFIYLLIIYYLFYLFMYLIYLSLQVEWVLSDRTMVCSSINLWESCTPKLPPLRNSFSRVQGLVRCWIAHFASKFSPILCSGQGWHPWAPLMGSKQAVSSNQGTEAPEIHQEADGLLVLPHFC